ncbi:hypothetical protein [Chloroflexus sp. Y-396-1]|uniref:hypothetical protein n=1 Tax=Chloroflexus sp. Y-396-1 TaxID=867845 RepID=UPI00048F04D6|nr:hypothetical protein [Chloroflexus sp. Y-396-1]
MMAWFIFWVAAFVAIGGQIPLIFAAWRLYRQPHPALANVPRSDGRADLGWTILTALATLALFAAAYLALP